MIKRNITGLLIGLLTAVAVQAQDFKISRFKENIMDLTAAQASVKDKNGDACALIKFSAKDDKFDFEPNLGIIKTEKKTGEVWIYVPHHTKLLTIRHQYLGVLRNYKIPVEIEQKVVYEADLEITNETYLNSLLLGKAVETPLVEVQKPIEPKIQKPVEVEVQKPIEPEVKPAVREVNPTVAKVKGDRDWFFEFGGGFGALGIMGPTGQIGFGYKNHIIEGGVSMTLSRVKHISIYRVKDDNTEQNWGAYNYGAMRFFARYGYNIGISSFVITPLIGGAINNIKGVLVTPGEDEPDPEYDFYSDVDLFKKANTISLTVGCRVSYCINKLLRVFVCPEFSLGIKKDRSFIIIKEADSKIKSMTDGIGVSAGFLFHI